MTPRDLVSDQCFMCGGAVASCLRFHDPATGDVAYLTVCHMHGVKYAGTPFFTKVPVRDARDLMVAESVLES